MLHPTFRMPRMIIMLGQRAAASAKRIYEVLDTKSDIVDGPVATDIKGDITFDDVGFTYPLGTRALTNATFTIPSGQTVALVGRTGSGKSTIARLLPRFYDVSQGKILVDGRDIREFRLDSLREQVGIV